MCGHPTNADTLLPPRTWLPYLCVYKIKLLQQKYSTLKYVNCSKITLTQRFTIRLPVRGSLREPSFFNGRKSVVGMSPNGMFLRLFILDFFPQWNLKIFLLSLSNPLFVLQSFRFRNRTANRFSLRNTPKLSDGDLMVTFSVLRRKNSVKFFLKFSTSPGYA